MSGRPVGQDVEGDDLHAYVGGQLDPARRAEVEAHLRSHPADAALVAAFADQREALRAALAPYAGGRIPPRLNPHAILARREMRRSWMWRAAAAIVAALGLGAGGGWALRGAVDPGADQIHALAREAMANHLVYTADRRRPTELGEDQRDDLARWVSNRLNHRVAPPDLSSSGFRYIGGRLAATAEGPGGMFMYQNEAGVRLTVFVRPDPAARDAPLSPVAGAAVGGQAWIEKGVGYSVVAPVPTEELRGIAEKVRRSLDRPA